MTAREAKPCIDPRDLFTLLGLKTKRSESVFSDVDFFFARSMVKRSWEDMNAQTRKKST